MHIKVCLIGCGRIAHKHIEVLSNMSSEFKVVGVHDVDLEKMNKFSMHYNVESFDSISEMVTVATPDIIVVLTESGRHADLVLECSKFSIDMIVEKPMALTKTDCEEMLSVCKKKGIKLNIVKQNRYNYPVQAARKALEDNCFGNLILGTIRVRWCRDQNYYDQANWRGTWEFDGGVLANQAAHHIDLLLWFFGEVESVYAVTKTALVDIEAEDTAIVTLQFKNGAVGILEATTATRPKDLEGSLTIMGSKGTVEIGGFAVNKLLHWNFEDKTADNIDFEMVSQNPNDVYGFGHVEFYKDIYRQKMGLEIGLVDGHEGMKTVELLEAIYQSAATGEVVKIGESTEFSKLGKRSQR